jgi:hypothetical protein
VHLVVLARSLIHADDFLKRDDVGIDLLQNVRDTLRPHTSIESTTFMNVVGCNAK